MLLSNYSVAYHMSCGREIGAQGGINNLFTYYNPGTMLNFFTGDHAVASTQKANLYSGNRQPYAIVWAPKGGELSSTTYVSGTGELIGSGALGYGINAALTGDGGITNAALGLIVSAIANLTGSGTISGNLLAFLNGSASLSGSGNLTAALGAIADVLASLSGDGGLATDIIAKGELSADIVVTGTGLTIENVAEAVWTAILSQYDSDANSAAAKLLAAGSAGDPWSTVLPGSYAGAQAGKLLDQIQTLVDELHKIQGLNADAPMTVTPDNRTAGTINLDITGDGETSTIVTRND